MRNWKAPCQLEHRALVCDARCGRASPGVSPVNATALIRGMFHKISDKPQPGMGVFPSEWLESTFMPCCGAQGHQLAQSARFSLQYGEPLGDAHLRRLLAKSSPPSTCTVPEHIITTVGPRMRWTS